MKTLMQLMTITSTVCLLAPFSAQAEGDSKVATSILTEMEEAMEEVREVQYLNQGGLDSQKSVFHPEARASVGKSSGGLSLPKE